MGIDHDGLRFDRADTDAVIARMRVAAAPRDGRQWMNVVPDVDPDDIPSSPGILGSAFSARGPAVPEGTWVPASDGRRGPTPASVGVGHGHGRDTLRMLRDDHGLEMPAGWVPRQDHPRRGIVVELHDTDDPETVLAFLVKVLEALCPVPCHGRFIAVFAERR